MESVAEWAFSWLLYMVVCGYILFLQLSLKSFPRWKASPLVPSSYSKLSNAAFVLAEIDSWKWLVEIVQAPEVDLVCQDRKHGQFGNAFLGDYVQIFLIFGNL